MDKNQPYRITLNRFDKWIDAVALMLITAMWLIAFCAYTTLPPMIPIHFDADGKTNGYGGKVIIFILPVIGTFIFMLLAVLSRHPRIFNYPVAITNANRDYQYTASTRIIRWLKLNVNFIFCVAVIDIYISAFKRSEATGIGWITILIVLVNIIVIYFFIKAVKGKTN